MSARRDVVDLGAIDRARDLAATRHAVSAILREWGRDNAGDIVTVLSELETNALRHAGGATGIRAELLGNTLRIEVDDRAPTGPTLRPWGNETGGFGLRIVDRLAERWGTDVTDHGKTVWAVVPCPPMR